MTNRVSWNQEYDNFIFENYKTMDIAELTKEFNRRFKKDVSYSAIKHRKQRLGLYTQSHKGFKQGYTPYNKKPIGSERTHYGNVLVKVAEPNTWVAKSRLMYEKYHNTKIPKGYSVIFLDGNNFNFEKDNLIMVKNTVNRIMNLKQYNLRSNSKELNETGILIAQIIDKRNELENARL